jgi:hypothetical protein
MGRFRRREGSFPAPIRRAGFRSCRDCVGRVFPAPEGQDAGSRQGGRVLTGAAAWLAGCAAVGERPDDAVPYADGQVIHRPVGSAAAGW